MNDTKRTERLNALFKSTGWTQKKFASECGYTQQYIGDLLKGKKPVQESCAISISKCLGVRVEYLLCEDDFKTERERVLKTMITYGEQGVKFEELLTALGNKIERKETEDFLNNDIVIVDDLAIAHRLSEKQFDEMQKEIFDFIRFKISRI